MFAKDTLFREMNFGILIAKLLAEVKHYDYRKFTTKN